MYFMALKSSYEVHFMALNWSTVFRTTKNISDFELPTYKLPTRIRDVRLSIFYMRHTGTSWL